MNKKQQQVLANLAAIFFVSGFSALVYQVSWQRLLFTGFGVDLTSITLIISVFMMGLGVGAFFGGRIADKFTNKIIIIFCVVELLIGTFGLFSYHLILGLQSLLVHTNLPTLAIMTFFLLLLPTFLMGLTLPLLTGYFNQFFDNVGHSIGMLYVYNTLGAAMGAIATGFILFNYLSLSQTIYVAAVFNLLVAGIIFVLYGRNHAL